MKWRSHLIRLCTAVLLVAHHPCFSQLASPRFIDSVRNAVGGMKDDTNKVKAYFLLSKTFSFRNADTGMYYSKQGLALAKRLGWKKGMGSMLNVLATTYARNSDHATALKYYQEALPCFKEAGYQLGVAGVLLNTGVMYWHLGDEVAAMNYYGTALEMAKQHGFKEYIAMAHENMGNVYETSGDLAKGLENHLISLNIKEQMRDTLGIITVKINIGHIYTQLNQHGKAKKEYLEGLKMATDIDATADMAYILLRLGGTSLKENDPAAAGEYLQRSLKVATETGDKQAKADAYSGVGELLVYKKSYIQALAFFREAYALHTSLEDMRGQANDLMVMGDIYMKATAGTVLNSTEAEMPFQATLPARQMPASRAAQLALAIKYLEQAAGINEKARIFGNLQQVYTLLAEAYEKAGQYEKAISTMHKRSAITDTIFSQESAQKMVRSQLGYEFNKKLFADSLQHAGRVREVRLKYERQQAYTLAGVGGVLVLLAFSVFAVRSNRLRAREQKRSEDLLLNILPADIAAELKNTGHTRARHYNEVTVLFTDFVNFTRVAEKMDPQALIDELHTCFTAFDEIMQKYGIEKIKTIGDAYLALAGAPRPDAEHATHMLQAAAEIVKYMENRYATLGNRSFEVRVGVHSGSVVAGTVGVRKFAYDIWGDTVNTAARMEQSSLPGRVNVSQSTYQLTKHKFSFEYRGELDAKNKGKLGMYFLIT